MTGNNLQHIMAPPTTDLSTNYRVLVLEYWVLSWWDFCLFVTSRSWFGRRSVLLQNFQILLAILEVKVKGVMNPQVFNLVQTGKHIEFIIRIAQNRRDPLQLGMMFERTSWWCHITMYVTSIPDTFSSFVFLFCKWRRRLGYQDEYHVKLIIYTWLKMRISNKSCYRILIKIVLNMWKKKNY